MQLERYPSTKSDSPHNSLVRVVHSPSSESRVSELESHEPRSGGRYMKQPEEGEWNHQAITYNGIGKKSKFACEAV